MGYLRRYRGKCYRFKRRISHEIHCFSQISGGRGGRRAVRISNKLNPLVLVMLLLSGFSAGIFLYCITTETLPQLRIEHRDSDQSLKANDFIVTTGYEIKESQSGSYQLTAKLPLIQSLMEGASDINAEISADFWYLLDPTPDNIAQAFSGWVEPQITADYTWEKNGSVVTVTVTADITSEYVYQPLQMTYEYRYDVKQRKVLKKRP